MEEQIQFQCRCGKVLKAPRKAAGKGGKCPRCNDQIVVPQESILPPAAVVAPPPSATATPPPTTAIANPPSKHLDELIRTSDPVARLRLGADFLQLALQHGEQSAAHAVLQSLACDDRGEVVVGLAFLIAQGQGKHATLLHEQLLKLFTSIGDSTMLGGKPLLRLAYVLGFKGDVVGLRKLVGLRSGGNGVNSIDDLARFLEQKQFYAQYRLMAWAEGLDQAMTREIFDVIPDHFPQRSTLIPALVDAAQFVKRHDRYQ
jgi:hypothetical protein